MPSCLPERHPHAQVWPVVAPPERFDRGRTWSQCERDGSLPRIDVIEDEVDISADDSSSEVGDGPEPSDYESEDEVSIARSVQRPPSTQTDSSDAWSSRYNTPPWEDHHPQPALPTSYQRRISIAGSQPFPFVSSNILQRNQEVSRRLSVPNIEMKYTPSDHPLTVRPSPTPSNPPLKLYPWMTRKEIPPPQREMLKCPYPTKDCTEILPKTLVLWRRHFAKKHGLAKDGVLQVCEWPDCGVTMGGRSLNRHVLMTHMDFKTTCPYCDTRLRSDHMQRHITKCSSNPATETTEE